MDKISSPKLYKQYGQAMETQKKYPEAEKAYALAKDTDSVVRLNLEFLGKPEKVCFSDVVNCHRLSILFAKQDHKMELELWPSFVKIR